MAGLLGYALAGAAAGVGEGLVEQAKAARDQAFRMFEIGERRAEAADNRAFTASEGDKTRASQVGLLGQQQQFQAGQNDAQRALEARRIGLAETATAEEIKARWTQLGITDKATDAEIANAQARLDLARTGEVRADKLADATIKGDADDRKIRALALELQATATDAEIKAREKQLGLTETATLAEIDMAKKRLALDSDVVEINALDAKADREARAGAVSNLTANEKGELVAITADGKTKPIVDGDGKPLKPPPEGASSASKASVYTATLKALTDMGEDTVTAIEIAREIAGLPAAPSGAGLTGEGATAGGPAVAEPKTKAEFDALPSGAYFRGPDGQIRQKP